MSEYWWAILIVAAILFGAGIALWMNTAAEFSRVVSPTASWLKRESTLNRWGTFLMTIGALLAITSLVIWIKS